MSIGNVGSALYSEALKALDGARKSGVVKKRDVAGAAGDSSGASDKVTISSQGNSLGRLAELAKGAPEIRSEKVAELKSALEDGSLKVDSRELAAKMFKEMSLESWF